MRQVTNFSNLFQNDTDLYNKLWHNKAIFQHRFAKSSPQEYGAKAQFDTTF